MRLAAPEVADLELQCGEPRPIIRRQRRGVTEARTIRARRVVGDRRLVDVPAGPQQRFETFPRLLGGRAHDVQCLYAERTVRMIARLARPDELRGQVLTEEDIGIDGD